MRHTGSPSAGSPPPAVCADRLQVVTRHMDQLILKEKMIANTKVELKQFSSTAFSIKVTVLWACEPDGHCGNDSALQLQHECSHRRATDGDGWVPIKLYLQKQAEPSRPRAMLSSALVFEAIGFSLSPG